MTRNQTTLRGQLHQKYMDYIKKPKIPDPNLKRDLKSGWMLPYLLQVDKLLWGRWNYWSELCMANELPDEPIPQIHFGVSSAKFKSSIGVKMLERCFNAISPAWQGWSTSTYMEYFFDWFLWGVGAKKEEPTTTNPNTSILLYQLFDLWPLLLEPFDYFGNMLALSGFGKGMGFYPTPHTVVELMVQMKIESSDDQRTLSVCDPCVGTGRMLLHASNYSLRLFGNDINDLVVKATLVNGWLYAPWLVKPIPWLENYSAENKPATVDTDIDWGDNDDSIDWEEEEIEW